MTRTQEEWQARERELLETTNRYLERARKADKLISAFYRALTKAKRALKEKEKGKDNG